MIDIQQRKLVDAPADLLAQWNALIQKAFNKSDSFNLAKLRPEITDYYFTTDTNGVVNAMGGIANFEAFAGVEIPTLYFCDLAVSIPHRNRGIAREITIFRVNRVMNEQAKQPRLLVADLDEQFASLTSRLLLSALDPYESRVVADPSKHDALQTILQEKTQFGPNDVGFRLVRNIHEGSDTRIKHHAFPSIDDFAEVAQNVKKHIRHKPVRDDEWLVFKGDQTKAFRKALDVQKLPPPFHEAVRFARIILPR
jgi:hypothetical protein